MTPRREYDTGGIYQRKSDGRWIGTIEDGWDEDGKRRRRYLTGRTRPQVERKLRDAYAAKRRGEAVAKRITVKGWADDYLKIRVTELSPKGYNAAANPIRKWVIPTIGHKRLDSLTPGDIRAVHDACRQADRQAADAHRALHTMLNRAVAEGHTVPPRILAVQAPTPPKSDRRAMTIDEGMACLHVASGLPHGSRWLFNILYGARLNECLGLTWDAVNLDVGEVVIEWQLQALPYNRPRDRSSGFRVPDGHEARHLVDAYHLVRPKSLKGYRVAPLLPTVRDSLLHWREIAPDNPHGLVWPNLKGRPANDKDDRAEWHALQATAGVSHPTRLARMIADGATNPHGYYHIHECRNFAATMLLEAGVPEHVVTDLLGHTAVATSLRYRTVRREPLVDAMRKVGERLQLD